jgi:hypothetical protein
MTDQQFGLLTGYVLVVSMLWAIGYYIKLYKDGKK